MNSPPNPTSPSENPPTTPSRTSSSATSVVPTPSLDTHRPHLPPPLTSHEISIIWHNVDSRSDFVCFRKESRGPIERILVDFARALETGVFEQVLSVNASERLFCVTVAARRNREEGIMDAVFMVL